jgi:hypothetical protein
MLTRRFFVAWLTSLIALPRIVRATVRRGRPVAGDQAVPSQVMIRALGEAVLPSELGEARREVASDAFWRWMNGYREGAELLHPYGSPRISYAGPSPVPGWGSQLTALDRAARAKHGAGFGAISVANRQALVREALSEDRSERLPSVASARHIALGLLAHFFGSSEATDLCYRAQIGRNKCRPLTHNGRKPLPVATS